jgi:hypothetical protein
MTTPLPVSCRMSRRRPIRPRLRNYQIYRIAIKPHLRANASAVLANTTGVGGVGYQIFYLRCQ